MPIYDYACSNCGRITEVIHGINDPGPRFCPECGAEGTMRKTMTTPSIVFKGSGWAKVDRRASIAGRSSSSGSKSPASEANGSTTTGDGGSKAGEKSGNADSGGSAGAAGGGSDGSSDARPAGSGSASPSGGGKGGD